MGNAVGLRGDGWPHAAGLGVHKVIFALLDLDQRK